MDVVITDVTVMHRGLFCVAGWCVEQRRMVRPVLAADSFWSPTHVGRHLFQLGNVIRVTPKSPQIAWRRPPHRREDLIIDQLPIMLNELDRTDFIAAIQLNVSNSVSELFDGHLIDGKYVDDGIECPSLGAIDIPNTALRFISDSYGAKKKLKCVINDSARQGIFGTMPYTFKVASKYLTDVWEQGGVPALDALRAGTSRAHVRIGLAGAFAEQHNRCFAMVNNVLFY